MMTLNNYNYEYLKGLSPRDLSNFYKTEMHSNREINKVFEKFVSDFISECPSGESFFLMGSDIQVPPTTMFIEVTPYQGNYIWRQVICNNKNKSVSVEDWYRMSADELKRALFYGMTRCSGDIYGPIKELRRCSQSEIAKGDMLDYIWEADKSEDKIFYLNNQYQEAVNENMKKQTIKLNESQLKQMIREALNELDPRTMASYAQKRQAQANGEMAPSQSQERRGMSQQQIQQQAQQGRQGAVDAWNRDYGWENPMEYGDYDNPNDEGYGKEYYKMGLSNDGTQYLTHWKQDLSNGGGVASKSSYFPKQNGGTEYYRARNGYEGNRQVDAKQLDGGDKVAYQMQTGTGTYNKKTGKWVNEDKLTNIIKESLKKVLDSNKK